MDSIKEKRLQKERGATPKEVLEGLLKNTDDIDDLIVVVSKENGDIESSVSCDSTLNVLGMLEVGKQDTLNIMYDAYHGE